MTREQLIEKGVDDNLIKLSKIYIDEISNSPFDSIEDFLFDYSFYLDVDGYDRKDVQYYIVGGNDKTIQVLVWLQKESF